MSKPSRPPTARMRRLASELLSLRTKAKLSRDEVSEQTGINSATLYRIETAKARPQARTLKALLDLYEVDDDKREALMTMLREASQQTWLQPYRERLSDDYNTLISFETEARALWTYGMTVVPGLLQTERYARRVIAGMLPNATVEQIEHRVETRMQRQTVLSNMKLWAIVDEAALRRKVGTSEEMREQIEHLRDAMQRPQVTLQVLPFDAGPHPAMLGAFDMLKFDMPVVPDIIYLEGLTGDLFLDDEASVKRYVETFEYLRAEAMRPAATEEFLTSVANEM
jgi:transcriptional regulator with XRE-family HTH domain